MLHHDEADANAHEVECDALRRSPSYIIIQLHCLCRLSIPQRGNWCTNQCMCPGISPSSTSPHSSSPTSAARTLRYALLVKGQGLSDCSHPHSSRLLCHQHLHCGCRCSSAFGTSRSAATGNLRRSLRHLFETILSCTLQYATMKQLWRRRSVGLEAKVGTRNMDVGAPRLVSLEHVDFERFARSS